MLASVSGGGEVQTPREELYMQVLASREQDYAYGFV